MTVRYNNFPKAKRSLGQNFLVDTEVVERIVGALDLSHGEHVFEIGPGRGALTEKLLETGAVVTAVEFDRDIAALLRERFGSVANFTLIESDVLALDLATVIKGGNTKVVGNLPYNISTEILKHLSAARMNFSLLVLMFQREVAERIAAEPGDSERGFLSVMAENAFTIERIFDIAPTAFRPTPKVWSSVVRFLPKSSILPDDKALERLVSKGFSQRRKTILNNLAANYPSARLTLESVSIDPSRRAQTLSLAEWHCLAVQFSQ